MSDNISLEINDREVAARIGAIPQKLRDRLGLLLPELAFKLESHIKEDKLSGQVLNVVTGRLRRSIFSRIEITDNSIDASVGSSGDVKYARIHEFGFSGSERVAAHSREIRQAFGRAISPKTVFVRDYTRSVNMPERSFLRSAFADMREEIVSRIQAAARDL